MTCLSRSAFLQRFLPVAALVVCGFTLPRAQSAVPEIISLTRDLAPRLGERVVLEVIISTNTPSNVRWLHGGMVVGQENRLVIPAVTTSDFGAYQVVAQNGAGTTTNGPVQLVSRPLRLALTESPHSARRVAGSSAAFIVRAESDDLISYQWWKGNQPLLNETGAVMRISDINASRVGDYQVVVSVPGLSATSRVAQLSLIPTPPTVSDYVLVGGLSITNQAITPLYTTNPVAYFGIGSVSSDGYLIHSDPSRQNRFPTNPEPAVVGMAALSPLSGYFWRADGTIQAWGLASQLTAKVPARIPGLRRLLFAYAETGLGIPVYALTDNHEVFRFTSDVNSPTHGLVTSLSGSFDLAVGPGFAVGLTADGNLLSARFKDATNVTASTYAPFGTALLPQEVGRLISIDATVNAVLALREDGQVFQWTAAGFDRAASQMMPGALRIGGINGGWVVLREDRRVSVWRASPRFLTDYEGPSPWDMVGQLEDVSDFQVRDHRCYVLGHWVPPENGIQEQPKPQVVSLGTGASFSVVPSNSLAKFQWHWNDTDIPGATNPVLRLAALRGSQAGTYSVTVLSPDGRQTLSQPALLSISAYASALPMDWSVSTSEIYSGDVAVDGIGSTYLLLNQSNLVKFTLNGDRQWTRDLPASSLPGGGSSISPVIKLAGNETTGVFAAYITTSHSRSNSLMQYTRVFFSPEGLGSSQGLASRDISAESLPADPQLLAFDSSFSKGFRFLASDRTSALSLSEYYPPDFTSLAIVPDYQPRVYGFSSSGFVTVQSHPLIVEVFLPSGFGNNHDKLELKQLDTDTSVSRIAHSTNGNIGLAGSYGGAFVMGKRTGGVVDSTSGFVGVIDRAGSPVWSMARLPIKQILGLSFRANGNLWAAFTTGREIVIDGLLLKAATPSQLVLIEFGTNGEVLWTQSVPGDFGAEAKLLPTGDGGFVLSGVGALSEHGVLPARPQLGSAFASRWARSSKAPKIVENLKSQVLEKGKSATLTIGVSGEQLTFTWFHDGVAIPNANHSFLVIPKMDLTDQGVYRVEVANNFGAILSDPANLNIGVRLTLTSDGGGRFTTSRTANLYPLGSVVQLNAFPDVGYGFLGWEGSVNSSLNPLVVTLTESMQLRARFIPAPLVLESVGDGTVTSIPTGPKLPSGSAVSLYARPGLWNRLEKWSDGDQTNPRTITIGLTNIYRAIFTPITELETNSLNGVKYIVPKGIPIMVVNQSPFFGDHIEANVKLTLQLLTSIPNGRIHYTLDGSLPTAASPIYKGKLVFTRGNSNLRAVAEAPNGQLSYVSDSVEIHVLGVAHITVTGSDQGDTLTSQFGSEFLEGTQITLSPNAYNEWSFLGWYGDNTSATAPLTLTLFGDTVVTPMFGAPIRITSAGNGSVSTEPTLLRYPAGAKIILMARPATGSYFSGWVDSPGVGALRTTTMTVPTHIYQAVFQPLPPQSVALNLGLVGDGTIDVSPKHPFYPLGSPVHLHAVPGPGASFVGWVEDPSTAEHLSTVLDKSKTYTARFVTTPEARVVITQSAQLSAWRVQIIGWPGQRYEIYQKTVDSLTAPGPWRLVDTITNPLGIREWTIPLGLRDPKAGFFQVVPIQ